MSNGVQVGRASHLCRGVTTAIAGVSRALDLNQWFNNVELVTAEKNGIETTTYVRNILQVLRRLQVQ